LWFGFLIVVLRTTGSFKIGAGNVVIDKVKGDDPELEPEGIVVEVGHDTVVGLVEVAPDHYLAYAEDGTSDLDCVNSYDPVGLFWTAPRIQDLHSIIIK
jgi:hypothetical protein